MPLAAPSSHAINPLLELPAVELRDRLAAGALRAVELAEACIARVEAREPEIGAWAWFDPDHVREQAADLDAHRASGRTIGPLHGLPVGIKDIIDTAGIPTENGTVLDADRVPTRDAWIVARLKQAGAVIMGKTATAELAFAHPAATRNPRAPSHTPGGSSSGSAAAVADRMAPLAIGTQTAGSVIRPAAFCGIVGFKPSFGAIPRTGILRQSPNLDTVGVFAADLAGAALLAEALFGHDAADAATAPAPAPGLLEAARAEPAETPAFGFVKGPAWESADDETKDAFAALAGSLAGRCEQVALPDVFAEALAARESINFVEMARNYHRYVDQGRDRLGPQTIEAIARGETISDRDYAAALELPAVLNAALERLFARFDAILTPAAPGPAPAGLASTGSPAFNGLWTLCGTPAITIPALEAANGLPMGVQLVGPRPGDARLLRTANWLVRYLAPPQQGGEATP